MFVNPAKVLFESLEARTLLAGISFQDNILSIVGYAHSKTFVSIPKDIRKLTINGTPQSRIDAIFKQIGKQQVKMIHIVTGDGNDKIVLDSSITIPTYVDAGSAKDTIITGMGDDTIFGGATRDRIDAGGGHNYIDGGSGDDAIQGQIGDTVWSGPGNDALMGVREAYDSAYATQRLSSSISKFSMASNTDAQSGFALYSVNVSDLTYSPGSLQPTASNDRLVAFNFVSERTVGGITTKIWRTVDGAIQIAAAMKQATDTRNITVSITNTGTLLRVTEVRFNIPRIFTSIGDTKSVMSTYRGGTELQWYTDGYTHQNSGQWPGYAYSPMAVFYDKVSTEGVGVVVFNDRLDSTDVAWVLSAGTSSPWAKVIPNTDPGDTSTYEVELFHGWNMPNRQYSHYRDVFLQPFMAQQSIAEAHYKQTGIWGSANWVNSNQTLSGIIQGQQAEGISGFLQYSPADGQGVGYEPFNTGFNWANQLMAASKIANLKGLGVLINPWISTRHYDTAGNITQVQQYLYDPAVQAIIKAQRDYLAANGTTYAFWDAGTVPHNGSGLEWMNVIASFMRAGIHVAPESGCDIAVYISGATQFYPYNYNDTHTVALGVTPYGTQFVAQHFEDTVPVGINAAHWWNDAIAKGMVPILLPSQVDTYLSELGLGGITSPAVGSDNKSASTPPATGRIIDSIFSGNLIEDVLPQ